MGAFSTETLRQGIEGDKAANLLSLYADDAEIRIVDRNTQPSNPRVLHGRSEIGEMLEDVYSRDIKAHKLEKCIMQGDQVAYTESCEYSDGVRVFAESMITLRDGKIAEQIMLQAWDE
ncbi:nuclear transport factor 2 family protein [Streptomyces justiciae]|uniref:nuclear transport factor 2 family protein n=1 Tax=Streptomyces justiciae TaxID=2780140 RepID=UPI002119A1E3|nr:nuclear transport factor 2 family protein [Streptomyces justiciae]MCW8381703.1 nuclear transport factor 2 family protein [Streptomyces justiciae]